MNRYSPYYCVGEKASYDNNNSLYVSSDETECTLIQLRVPRSEIIIRRSMAQFGPSWWTYGNTKICFLGSKQVYVSNGVIYYFRGNYDECRISGEFNE